MRPRRRSVAKLAILASAVALLLPVSGGVNAADDTALFANQVPPNVVFIFDNSLSMNHIVWHPAYSPDLFYDGVCSTDPADPAYDEDCLQYPLCPIAFGDPEFEVGANDQWSGADGGVLETDNGTGTIVKSDNSSDCGDRVVFADPAVDAVNNDTLWSQGYLRWYFSKNVDVDDDGDGKTILEEILDTDDGVRSQCLIDAGKSATYARYRRARVTAAKDILREVICNTSLTATVRYGLAKFFPIVGGDFDPEGGFVTVAVDDYSDAQAQALEDEIANVDGETTTPVGETLYNVYRYFQSRDATATAIGKNGTTRFPVYNFDINGSTAGSVLPSPIESECQHNFVVLITDGEPTYDDFDNMNFTRFDTELIGDFNNPGDEVEDVNNSLETARYLDDIAKFMHERDFLPGSAYPDTQTIDVYTVGFTTNAVANDLLSRAAQVGGGEFFASTNAEELTEALTETLADIVAKSKAFTAATVPASRATDGNNFFTSYFTPSKDNPFWSGHLKLFDFNAKGEVLDAPSPIGTGACALNDPQAPTRCRVGGLNLGLNGFWDAGKVVPAANSRNLYVSRYQGGAPSTLPAGMDGFDEATVTTDDLGVTGATSSDIAAYDIAISGFDLTGIDTDTELKDAIVGYIRGCDFDNGACTDRGELQKLWDIFHSNPVVVGPPNSGLAERSYRDFVVAYQHRKRVIYAGSNGGFLHGFNAGEWDASATPPAYDRGTGVEEFGFMAYPARQQIAKRPRDLWPRGEDGWSGYAMDGPPSAADVWFYQDSNDDPEDADMSWQDWRTVLVGGMRQGGEVVWALDVTDPDGITGEPTVYPGYLWEFPCENSACDGWRPYMGQTWSQPVITRVKATLDCGDTVSTTGCATYDRWVAIFGAGYDDAGDPNLPHDADSSLQAGEYDPSNDANTSKKGRAIFMIDVTTGEVLAAKRYAHNGTAGDSSDEEPGMKFAFAGAPAVFDVDFDGYADVVYMGDLGGNLWKWVIHDPAQDHINGSEGDDHQARWPFLKLLAAQNCTTCSPKHYKSFFYPATGALVGPNLWLALGSGERANLNFGRDGGLSTEEKNRFYVFKDQDPLELERDPADLPLTDASGTDFIDGTTIATFNPNSCLSGGSVGFYFEGDQGEKFITDNIIFFGVVFAGSYIPAPSTANPCSATGEAFLYGFDLFCGEGRFPPASGDPNDPKERRIQVGEGLPNSPRVSVGPTDEGPGDPNDPDDPCRDMVIVITSDNGGYSDGRCERSNSGLGLQTWRDR